MTESPSQQHARMHASDRRSQLVDTALNIFSQKGFNGATTKEIAAAAGVTEAVIFRHFPTKQALYQAVLESETNCRGFEEWLAEAQACMDRNDDAGLFRLIVTSMIKSFRTDARLERVLLFAALEGNEQGLSHNRRFSLPIFQLLSSYILRRQREGAIGHYDPGVLLVAITGMAQRFGTLTQFFGIHVDLTDEEVVDAFTQIFMNGIQAR